MNMQTLGQVYGDQGRYDASVTLFLEVLEIRKRVLGEEHPETARAMGDLGYLYILQGAYEKAEPLAARVVEIHRVVLGDEQPGTLNNKDNLGFILLKTGRVEKAEAMFRDIVATAERTGLDKFRPAFRAHHGMSLVELGRYEEGEALLLGAYPHLPPIPPSEIEETIRYLVKLYDTWGKPEKAAEWRAKLPTEQEAVASDQARPTSPADDKQDN